MRRGIDRQKSVILMMRNRQEFVEVGAAAARAGASAVAISWRSTPKELVYLATHSGARGIVLEAELLERILSEEGHHCTVCRTLRAAEEAVAEAVFDTVVLDRMLPDGDGLALCARLRCPDARCSRWCRMISSARPLSDSHHADITGQL